MFVFRKKSEMPSAAKALPGRATPDPDGGDACDLQAPAEGAIPGRNRERAVRHGLLLGRRAQVLAAAGAASS